MSNDKNPPARNFYIPKDPRQRAVWLRRWIESIFKVYESIIKQIIEDMSDLSFDQVKIESEAVKNVILDLITPEKWEREDEPGKS